MQPDTFNSKIRSHIINHKLLYPFDLLLVGATGAGKSSTINAIFGSPQAKIGEGVDPETQEVHSYTVGEYFRVHDSAGLGDGASADLRHAKNITQKLLEPIQIGGQQYGLIDMALVILDGSSRDLGTAFKLLQTVVTQTIQADRIAVAINQADMAMKGRNRDPVLKRPNKILADYLKEQAEAIQRRVFESTNCNLKLPITYSAKHNYNIDCLVDHVISCIPTTRRKIV